jgi:hypothetical protein
LLTVQGESGRLAAGALGLRLVSGGGSGGRKTKDQGKKKRCDVGAANNAVYLQRESTSLG